MLVRVLFEELGFLFGTFFLALPVAAELVVKEFERGEVGFAGVGIVLEDLFEVVFVHLRAHVGVALFGGGTG